MSVVGRSLYSASAAANTGLHSAAVIPGLGPGATFTVFFAIYSTSSNSFDTVWANGDGDCQLFMDNSGQLTARYGNSSSSSGAKVSLPQDEWCFVACKFGLDFDGNDDVGLEIYRTGDDSTDYVEQGTSTVASSIEGDEVHYVLSDDPGGTGGPSDDGFRAYLFGLALVDGLWSLDELGCDTTIGEAKNFDAGAEAALIYALRGEDDANPGADNSGNGRHFNVESGGVVLSEAMLPPGVSAPSSAAQTASASASGAATATVSATRTRLISASATGTSSVSISARRSAAAQASAAASASATAAGRRVRSGSASAPGTSAGSIAAIAIKAAAATVVGTALAAADATAVCHVSASAAGAASASLVATVPGQSLGAVQYPAGGTGSADFAAAALDAGWSEGVPGAAGYSGWTGWAYANGRAVAEFALADGGDPGTTTAAGQDAPRLVTDVADGDFQIDYAVAAAIYEDQTGSSQYVGTGFYVELTNGNSARLDHYRLSGSDATKGYRNLANTQKVSSGIDPINANGGSRGHPGFFRLTRVGDTWTVYCSYDGINFAQTDQFTWAVSVARVGVLAYKIGNSCTATIALEYIHLNQTAGFAIAAEPQRTPLLVEDFTDLANWSLNNSGSASIAASGGAFQFSVPTGDTHSARLMFPTAARDAGMLMRVQTSATGANASQGFWCPAFRQRGPVIEPFGLGVGYVFEINAQDNDIRIVSSQSADYSGPLFDGVYSYLHEDLALSGFSLESTLTWLRCECFGPVLRWKYWADGETEPTGWDATIYDTSIPEEGQLGIVYAHNRTEDTVLTAELSHLEVYELTDQAPALSASATAAGSSSAALTASRMVPATATASGTAAATVSAVVSRKASATATGAATASATAGRVRSLSASASGAANASLVLDTDAKQAAATAAGGSSAQASAHRVRHASAQTAGEGTATASTRRTAALAAYAEGGATALVSPGLIATARATAAGTSSAVLAVGNGIEGRAARVGGITQRTELALSRNRWLLRSS